MDGTDSAHCIAAAKGILPAENRFDLQDFGRRREKEFFGAADFNVV